MSTGLRLAGEAVGESVLDVEAFLSELKFRVYGPDTKPTKLQRRLTRILSGATSWTPRSRNREDSGHLRLPRKHRHL